MDDVETLEQLNEHLHRFEDMVLIRDGDDPDDYSYRLEHLDHRAGVDIFLFEWRECLGWGLTLGEKFWNDGEGGTTPIPEHYLNAAMSCCRWLKEAHDYD